MKHHVCICFPQFKPKIEKWLSSFEISFQIMACHLTNLRLSRVWLTPSPPELLQRAWGHDLAWLHLFTPAVAYMSRLFTPNPHITIFTHGFRFWNPGWYIILQFIQTIRITYSTHIISTMGPAKRPCPSCKESVRPRQHQLTCQMNADDGFTVPSTEEGPSTLLPALLSTPVLVLIHHFSIEDQTQ